MLALLAILFALQGVYTRRAVLLPLQRAVRRAGGVLGDSVATTPGGLRVDVRLGLVPNLREAYLRLEGAVGAAAGGMPVSIHLEDARTPALLNDYYALNAIIEQGRVTGQFVQMDAELAQAARRLGLRRAQVVVGNEHLYVELVQGPHYLYEILPLYAPAPAAVSGAAAS
jgi:hypothetical protein